VCSSSACRDMSRTSGHTVLVWWLNCTHADYTFCQYYGSFIAKNPLLAAIHFGPGPNSSVDASKPDCRSDA
jgi:hypothetical protein